MAQLQQQKLDELTKQNTKCKLKPQRRHSTDESTIQHTIIGVYFDSIFANAKKRKFVGMEQK
jgi:hypothetical protein